MWVCGGKFATNIAVLKDINCKLVVDCTPSLEGSQGESPFDSIWPADAEPPAVISWSILSSDHKGTEMLRVMDMARKAWMGGSSILFHDRYGDRRCIVAVCVFLREAVDHRSGLCWLTTLLKPSRTLNSVLLELADRYDENSLMEFKPNTFPEYIIAMDMQDKSAS